MRGLARFQVNHLFLLVGSNPLPNYVAAQLLAAPGAEIVLVYSDGVRRYRDTLTRELSKKGYTRITPVEVEESNPTDVFNKVARKAQGLPGTVGLHYTGGTKAMSVHAYRAIERTVRQADTGQKLFYSYLDARHLSLWVEGAGLTGSHQVGVRAALNVSIKEMLDLHGLKRPAGGGLRTESLWSGVTQALAIIHVDPTKAAEWRNWRRTRLKSSPSDRNLLPINCILQHASRPLFTRTKVAPAEN